MSVRSVRGRVLDPSGAPAVGAEVRVYLSIPTAVATGGMTVQDPSEAFTDPSGYFFFNLYANADLTPSGTSYIVSTWYKGLKSTYAIVVTNAAYSGSNTFLDIT